MLSRKYAFVVSASCLAAVGCWGASDRPELVPVHGVVTYHGQPVEGARVKFFLPDAPRGAVGMTDENGRYVLTTFEEGDGAVPGEHQVTIFKKAPPAGAAAAPAAAASTAEGGPAMGGTNVRQWAAILREQTRSALPQKYADPKTSGLVRIVESGGDHEFNFELED